MNIFRKFLLLTFGGWKFVSIPSLFFLILTFHSGEIGAFSLYLSHVAVVKNTDIKLSDISRVDAEKYPGRISKHILFRNLNSPRYIGRSELKSLLSGLSESADRIYGKGVWVLPLTETIKKDKLHTMLLQEIDKLPGSSEDRKALSLYIDSDAEILCTKKCSINFNLPSSLSRLFAGKRVISADIKAERKGRTIILHRQQFTIRVLKSISVPVALRNLSIGMRLTKDDFKMETRELDPDESYHATGNIIGRRVVAHIPAGGVLNHSSIQFLPSVRRGQSIEVVYQTPNLVLKLRSVAASDGEIGDTIPVRMLLPSGKKTDIKKVKIVSDKTAVLE
ncbi:MAG: flagellar basal body P-ring formation chaperone FlgA [Spirochaetia bacterium]|nr:flagellar basal body P-ring formation chaperone FlgA [Spirochaetia bacterium]